MTAGHPGPPGKPAATPSLKRRPSAKRQTTRGANQWRDFVTCATTARRSNPAFQAVAARAIIPANKDLVSMRRLKISTAAFAPVLLLQACASTPTGPSVAVMPAPGKPFEVFQQDQAYCKQYADRQVQGAAQSANNRQVGTAIIGTVLGAGLGAAVGGGHGAAIGAGAGAVGGTAFGAGPAAQAQYSLQQRYDIAYSQCMYSRGNQVPGFQPAPPPGYPPPGAYPGGYPPPGAYPGGYPPG
jgi:hypothetical protein